MDSENLFIRGIFAFLIIVCIVFGVTSTINHTKNVERDKVLIENCDILRVEKSTSGGTTYYQCGQEE